MDTAKLFARLTCVIEDMHGIAIEGQVADLPDEAKLALAAHLTTGLQQARALMAVIEQQVSDPK